jgi:hypothetical protein
MPCPAAVRPRLRRRLYPRKRGDKKKRDVPSKLGLQPRMKMGYANVGDRRRESQPCSTPTHPPTKFALWLAVGPFTYFFIGPAFRARTHDELDRGGVLLFTLKLWPLMCWLIQREWHERRTMIRYKNPPRWGMGAFRGCLRVAHHDPRICEQESIRQCRPGITAPICYSLYNLMARACTREQEEKYG